MSYPCLKIQGNSGKFVGNTVAKMTQEEIRVAGQAAKDAYYNEGYDAGKKIAVQLEGEMIRRGNTSSDDKYTFREATSYS